MQKGEGTSGEAGVSWSSRAAVSSALGTLGGGSGSCWPRSLPHPPSFGLAGILAGAGEGRRDGLAGQEDAGGGAGEAVATVSSSRPGSRAGGGSGAGPLSTPHPPRRFRGPLHSARAGLLSDTVVSSEFTWRKEIDNEREEKDWKWKQNLRTSPCWLTLH
jgi:hypothetical protein